MRTAPPTEPGMPTKNSRPPTPAAAARRASTGSATAPPGVDAGAASRSTSSCSNSPPSTIATPSKPASATSRFEPRPIDEHGDVGACGEHVGDGREVGLALGAHERPRAGRRSGTS